MSRCTVQTVFSCPRAVLLVSLLSAVGCQAKEGCDEDKAQAAATLLAQAIGEWIDRAAPRRVG
jgi:hypothetical protein